MFDCYLLFLVVCYSGVCRVLACWLLSVECFFIVVSSCALLSVGGWLVVNGWRLAVGRWWLVVCGVCVCSLVVDCCVCTMCCLII